MIIELGAMAPKISEQLESANLVQTGTDVSILDRLNHSITLAHLHGCLSDSECERARKRLINKIKAAPKEPRDGR